MDKKTIEAIQERIEADAEAQEDFAAYDNIVNLKWDLPDGWSAKEWVRKQISTDGLDAIQTATNIYDTNNPKWEILPKGLADKDRAEELETALEWWMQRANKIGANEPFRQALRNSVLQNRVIMQLDYLPYWLPKDKSKWSKEQKAAMKLSSFCITVHDARNVYYEIGKYGLKWVAAVSVISAADVISHWSAYVNEATEEGKQIKRAIAKIESEYADNDELKYIHVDYTSHDKREVSVFQTESDSIADFENIENMDNKIDILDTENKMSFVNWIVVQGEGNPMLYAIHKAGLWENQNIYNTLTESTTMRRAVFPILKHTSPTGKSLEVDYSGEQDVLELQNGEAADVMVPPPLDPAMTQISAANTAKIAQTTGIKGLASVEIAGNVQYAAIQAVIQLHMTTIVPYVRTVEKAFAQLGDMAFMWIQESGSTEIAYRTKSKGEGKEKGMDILISADTFDPDEMHISCKLIANTPTDQQQKVNMIAQLKQAGAHIAWKETLETLGFGNGEILEAEWLDEEVQTVALQQKIKELDAQLQLMVAEQQQQLQLMGQMQAQQMQMQAMAQQGMPNMPQPQGQAQPSQGNPMMPGGQGFNAAMGGQPTAEAMPGATSPL